MLTQEPGIDSARVRPRTSGPSKTVSLLLASAAVVVLVLRHDYWNWDTPGYLLFGFLPVGLWWQALVSVLASPSPITANLTRPQRSASRSRCLSSHNRASV